MPMAAPGRSASSRALTSNAAARSLVQQWLEERERLRGQGLVSNSPVLEKLKEIKRRASSQMTDFISVDSVDLDCSVSSSHAAGGVAACSDNEGRNTASSTEGGGAKNPSRLDDQFNYISEPGISKRVLLKGHHTEFVQLEGDCKQAVTQEKTKQRPNSQFSEFEPTFDVKHTDELMNSGGGGGFVQITEDEALGGDRPGPVVKSVPDQQEAHRGVDLPGKRESFLNVDNVLNALVDYDLNQSEEAVQAPSKTNGNISSVSTSAFKKWEDKATEPPTTSEIQQEQEHTARLQPPPSQQTQGSQHGGGGTAADRASPRGGSGRPAGPGSGGAAPPPSSPPPGGGPSSPAAALGPQLGRRSARAHPRRSLSARLLGSVSRSRSPGGRTSPGSDGRRWRGGGGGGGSAGGTRRGSNGATAPGQVLPAEARVPVFRIDLSATGRGGAASWAAAAEPVGTAEVRRGSAASFASVSAASGGASSSRRGSAHSAGRGSRRHRSENGWQSQERELSSCSQGSHRKMRASSLTNAAGGWR